MRNVMIAAALGAFLAAGAVSSAAAQESKITMPDGWVVHVVTTNTGSLVTTYDASGKVDSKLRYPDYKGEERHQPLLMILTPEGAKTERIR